MSYVAVLPFLMKFPFFAEAPVFGALEELTLAFLIPTAWIGLRTLYQRVACGKAFLSSYCVYLCLGVASWPTSGLSIGALLLQFLLELKVPLLVCLFIGLGNPRWIYKRFLPVLKGLLLLSIPLIVFQFGWPNLYDLTFPASAHAGRLWVGYDLSLARAAGMFRHPGQLAFVSAIVAAVFFMRTISHGPSRNLHWFLLALLILLCTLERQEIVAVAVLLPSIGFITHRSRVLGEKFVLGSVITIGTAVVLAPLLSVLSGYIQFVSARLQVAAAASSQAARVIFYLVGFNLANEHFPLGVGFGGFGGYAAKVFDSPYYTQFGFARYAWYRQGMFMTDTFWPHVYAEAGWLGFMAYALALGALVIGLWGMFRVSGDRESRLYIRIALFSIAFLISTSLTSAAPTSMLPAMLSFMFLYGRSASAPKATSTGSSRPPYASR